MSDLIHLGPADSQSHLEEAVGIDLVQAKQALATQGATPHEHAH